MRVTDLQIDGFGVWSQLHVEALSDHVTVFYGANEAGKTTLMQFIRTVLYGVSPERRGRYLPPVHGGAPGGVLQVEHNHQQLEIQRYVTQFGLADEEEQFEILAADGAILSSSLLDQLLTGVDELTFNNVFAVGLRELQELGTLDDTDAAELLYKLTTGLDRVSLVDVMQELEAACRQLLAPDNSASRIIELQQRRDQLQQRVDELGQNGEEWLALAGRRGRLSAEADQLAARIEDLTGTSQVVDAAIQTQELWAKRASLQRQLELVEPTPEIPASSLQKLEQLQRESEELQQKVKTLKRRRHEIRQEISLLPLNEKVGAQAARIEALNELSPWIVSLQTQVDQVRGEVQALEAKLAHSSTPLGLSDEVATDQLPDISRGTLSQLRAPARAVRDETQRLKQAQSEYETARMQCDEMVTELETALLDRGQEDLALAVEQTGSDASRLRRRLQLEERLEQMMRQKKQLQEDHHELLNDQVLSLKTLGWLGVPFVIGVMLVIGGLVWSRAASLGWPVAILGLAGWAVAVIAKITMERSAARDLEQCERQLELVTAENKQTQKEIEELDVQVPHDTSNLERKLEESEKELATLEQLVPLEAKVQTARQRVQAAQRRLEQLTESAQDAQARWQSELRRAHLPETLSPQAVRQLAEGNKHLYEARRQLELKREALETREQELESLSARIMQIAEDVEMNYTVSDPQQLLNHLSVAASEQQALQERRRKLRREDRKIKNEGQRVVSQLRNSQTRRRAILARAGVESEEELREIAARSQQRQLLENELNEINQQMQLALGNRFEFERVERELVDHSREELEERYGTLAEQSQQCQEELAALHQQQGALEQQSRTLLDDRRMAELKLELGCVQQKLFEAAQRWRILAVTATLLETVRVIYETHRQPQTLVDASHLFQQLTDGQYTRIWTPLTDMSLRVDLSSGESLPLDVLSCGTREAVFLSLRLALAADFARRGIMLPLVLDDVLVNFDRQRAGAAAKVLCEFAEQGHQILVFTCHEHIVELFQALNVPVRCLSSKKLFSPRVDSAIESQEALPAEEETEVIPVTLERELGAEDTESQLEDQEPEDDYELLDEDDLEPDEDEDVSEYQIDDEDGGSELEYYEEDEEAPYCLEKDYEEADCDAEPIDGGDDDDDDEYRLKDEEEVVPHVDLSYLLLSGQDEAHLNNTAEDPADETETESEGNAQTDIRDESATRQKLAARTGWENTANTSDQRFAWESPERWWQPPDDRGEAA